MSTFITVLVTALVTLSFCFASSRRQQLRAAQWLKDHEGAEKTDCPITPYPKAGWVGMPLIAILATGLPVALSGLHWIIATVGVVLETALLIPLVHEVAENRSSQAKITWLLE